MAGSRIYIDFDEVPKVDDSLSFREHKLGIDLIEIFKQIRSGSGQTELPKQGYELSIRRNYATAIILDYCASDLFSVSTDGGSGSRYGQVLIEASYPGAVFTDIGDNIPGVTVDIQNETAIPEIAILSTTFSEASANKCNSVKVTCTTNVLATKIMSPIQNLSNTENPFSFDWIRGTNMTIDVYDAAGHMARGSYVTPSLLNASNFLLQINNSPNGATVIIIPSNSEGLNLLYSLDNINWQSSNTFSGLAVGDFTLYVKDHLGCSINKPFAVDEFGIQNPYFYISKSNSIRYANRITWGDSGNYKTDENTLSCEVDVDVPYKEVQQFQSADIPPTQFKSNYSSNVAKIIKADLTEIDIPIEKKTSNIGVKDKRDARKYNLGDGRTGVYFLSGNTYDFDTNVIVDTYTLNGLLPEWAIVGNYITISNAWFLIEEIVFDESKNADVLIFSQNYTGSEISIIAGSIFNRFNYEVYEFTVDMVDYIDQRFRVKLINSDPNFTTITHLSEEIWCKVKHDDVIEIRYRNTSNTDVFYSTGIEFLIRIPITIVKGKPDEESEIHKTDTNTILLSADLREGDEFIFEPVTKEIWRKIMIALSHEKVWLNGVSYVKNGSFSTEGPLEKSNLYVLTANMLKTGSVYSSLGDGSIDYDGTAVEVPGLILTHSGYLNY